MIQDYLRLKSGFTLIEVLVITGLTAILLLSSSAIFMTFLVNQSLISQKQQIKIEGDNALKQMSQVLREAKVVEECGVGKSNIIFSDLSGNQATFDNTNDRVASKSGNSTTYLTSENLALSNFLTDCFYVNNSYLVKIQFTLTNPGPNFNNNPLNQTFSTTVNLRN